MDIIPYGRQDISESDIQAVVDVLRSDFLTQGPTVPAFEQAIADYCKAEYAVAVNSATSALHIACLSLGVGPGDWVWTSPITFVASANCALYCGAQIDFVDIDSHTYNLSVPRLAEKLATAKELGRLPKVLIPVHLCGQSCDMASISVLAKEYGFQVIEDASHAIGGRYAESVIGGCRYSDITIFSFHPVKVITSAEGGMALTNDSELAARMSMLRSHGITRETSKMRAPRYVPWHYEQLCLGYNYRMTDIHAALGLSQLGRLDEFVERRNVLAKRYDQLLAELALCLPVVTPENRSAFHLYVVRTIAHTTRRAQAEVLHILRERGIGANLHYFPVHLQPYYSDLGFRIGDFPEAEKYANDAVTLPLYPGLTELEQDSIVAVLAEVLA